MTNKHIKKTDAELIFTRDCVYKIFTTDIVTKEVIEDLFRLDKLANRRPLFLEKTDVQHSPFSESHIVGNPPVIVMRLVDDINALSTLAKHSKLDVSRMESLANTLYSFHDRTKFLMTDNPTYFADRLDKDLSLVADIAQKDTSIARVYQKLIEIAEKHRGAINSRTKISPVVEGHGDLNLDHIYLEGHDFCFIDFSHKKKYRLDDPSRDLAGVVLHLLELKNGNLVQPFIDSYKSHREDENFDLMLKLQLGKKFLVKYFIYYGGFAPEHREDDQIELCLNSADSVLRFISN